GLCWCSSFSCSAGRSRKQSTGAGRDDLARFRISRLTERVRLARRCKRAPPLKLAARLRPEGLGKDAPLGRHIERSVTIAITPILSGAPLQRVPSVPPRPRRGPRS